MGPGVAPTTMTTGMTCSMKVILNSVERHAMTMKYGMQLIMEISRKRLLCCNALSNCKWYDSGGSAGCSVDTDRVKKIISDTGAPPGVAGYWIGFYTDACWYLPKSTCTTSTTVRGCELSDYDDWPCRPSLAKRVVAGADGCTGHADFEAVAALGGMTVAEAREKSMAKTAKE